MLKIIAALTFTTVAYAAPSIPQFDTKAYCVAHYENAPTTHPSGLSPVLDCLNTESVMYRELKETWAKISDENKAFCIAQSESYYQLGICASSLKPESE
jgi:hypothetical protein